MCGQNVLLGTSIKILAILHGTINTLRKTCNENVVKKIKWEILAVYARISEYNTLYFVNCKAHVHSKLWKGAYPPNYTASHLRLM